MLHATAGKMHATSANIEKSKNYRPRDPPNLLVTQCSRYLGVQPRPKRRQNDTFETRYQSEGGGDPERIISVPVCGQMGAIPGAPFFGIRPDGQMGVIFGSPFPRNPKSSRTAKIQSKVLPDRKKSIQSPTGPQKFNPKSY